MAVMAPAGLILTAYGVGLVLVNTAILLWVFLHSPQHRWPVALMLGGQLASRALYIARRSTLALAGRGRSLSQPACS